MTTRPEQPRQGRRKAKPDSKEDRLADALRANLRRRKAPRKTDPDEGPATEKPQDES